MPDAAGGVIPEGISDPIRSGKAARPAEAVVSECEGRLVSVLDRDQPAQRVIAVLHRQNGWVGAGDRLQLAVGEVGVAQGYGWLTPVAGWAACCGGSTCIGTRRFC